MRAHALKPPPAAIAVAGGVAATFAAAALVGMSWHDSLRILTVAGLGALVAAPVAAALFAITRGRSVALQVSVVACTTVLVCAAALVAAARAMFVSNHDAEVLVVVLIAAATAGITAALAFASRYGKANRELQAAARRIGDGDLDAEVALNRPATAEMTALARDLDDSARRLAAARAHEVALERARHELVVWLSHDLRAPIAGLVAVSEALEDDIVDDPETRRRYLATIHSEAHRLADLIDQLFELSLVETASADPQLEPATIDDIIADALTTALAIADPKHIRLELVAPTDVPPIAVDVRGINRVLVNLLDNAVRHTPAGGAITIAVGRDAGGVTIAVSDQCGGIPIGELVRVFDHAYRGDTARTPHGTARGGLGLTIARTIARAHNGGLTVRNRDDGCTFTLWLPATPGAPGRRTTADRTIPTGAARR